jgi:hypothetical protein
MPTLLKKIEYMGWSFASTVGHSWVNRLIAVLVPIWNCHGVYGSACEAVLREES